MLLGAETLQTSVFVWFCHRKIKTTAPNEEKQKDHFLSLIPWEE